MSGKTGESVPRWSVAGRSSKGLRRRGRGWIEVVVAQVLGEAQSRGRARASVESEGRGIPRGGEEGPGPDANGDCVEMNPGLGFRVAGAGGGLEARGSTECSGGRGGERPLLALDGCRVLVKVVKVVKGGCAMGGGSNHSLLTSGYG